MRGGAQSGRVAPRFRFRAPQWYGSAVRLRPALTRLLVLLLLLQWGTAFGHCLKLAAPHGALPGVLHMDICTPEGLRSIALQFDPGEAPKADHAAGMLCPLCGGLGGAALPPPPVALLPPLLLVQTEAPPPPSTPSPAPPPRCQPPPRAPPTS
nr:DUF2946 family protein [Falsiroseomonas tokyonensis]